MGSPSFTALAMKALSGQLSNTRGLPGHGCDGVDHGGKGFELKLDEVGEILGLGAGRLHAGNDRLADITHPLVGERRIRAVTMGRELGTGFEDVERADIGQGEDVAGGARRPDDAADVGMRHVTADESHVLHAGHPDVGNERAVAEQMPGILLAQHARSDPTVGGRRNGHVRLLFRWRLSRPICPAARSGTSA